tara:strand:+ start:1938 stop:3071 length:1134 start_codon:yes stop_codon:yes gene_type:complete
MANLLDKASILLTPNAYNVGSMLSIKPTNGDGDFTFSRNGNASRVNSSGIIVTEGANLPRINYENGCGSWLFEPQSTNLVPYSEDFTQWIISGDVTVESGYLAPDGTNNAYKISGTDNNIKTTIASLIGTSQRTIFARTVSGIGTAKLLTHRNNTNNLFNITEQWQRFEVNSTTDTTSQTSFFGIDFRGGSLTEIILWGANATNDQDYATSYIPTSGASSTRLQDLATDSGNATLINSTEGVLYAEIATLSDDGTNRCISLYDGSLNNRLTLVLGTSSNSIRTIIKSNGSNSFDEQHIVTSTLNYNKVAVKYKANDFALWINGVEVATDTSGATPIGLDRITFDTGNGNLNFYGKTKALAVYKEALTDAQLTALTTI